MSAPTVMSERLVLSSAASSALGALSRALLAATRTASLYTADHPVVRASIERVQQAVMAATEADVAGAITVMPSALLVGGAVMDEKASAADVHASTELASHLHACGVLEIGFDVVVPAEAIAQLLAFLARLSTAADSVEGIAEAWLRDGHSAIRLEAVDYRTLLADRDPAKPGVQGDDVWRALVSALRSGRRSFDAGEQQRLLELTGDPIAIATLAETLTVEQCTPDGSPLLTTQATTILAAFRQLASVAAVIAPDRAPEVLRNLASALSRLNPHVSMQVLSVDRRREGGEGGALADALDEEALARIVAAAVALEGGASSRLAEVFELLVPDRGGQRRVLERARLIAAGQVAAGEGSDAAFDAFWTSIEALLLPYDDQPFVSEDYRVVLDANRAGDTAPPAGSLPELAEWMETLGERSLQHLSITLLTDLLRLELATDRAVVVLNHLAALAEDLLLAGEFEEALRVLEAISAACRRDDLATAVAQVLQRLGAGAALAETTTTIAELGDGDWGRLQHCYLEIGPSALAALDTLVTAEQETPASTRVTRVVAAMGEEAIAFLGDLLKQAGGGGRVRIAALLGEIGRPAAVPALQALLRSPEPRVLQAAVGALAGIDDPAAARALHVALAATDGDKRQAVVNALVMANDRLVVPLLVRVLEECHPLGQDFQVALHVLDALARLADPRAVSSIARIMMLRSWRSRRRLRALKRACVLALARTTDGSATHVLDQASRSGDRMLRGMLRAARAAAPAGAV
ncbi:MAG: HEAT repeat domain-containing protein [Bacteroidales bacterium]